MCSISSVIPHYCTCLACRIAESTTSFVEKPRQGWIVQQGVAMATVVLYTAVQYAVVQYGAVQSSSKTKFFFFFCDWSGHRPLPAEGSFLFVTLIYCTTGLAIEIDWFLDAICCDLEPSQSKSPLGLCMYSTHENDVHQMSQNLYNSATFYASQSEFHAMLQYTVGTHTLLTSISYTSLYFLAKMYSTVLSSIP